MRETQQLARDVRTQTHRAVTGKAHRLLGAELGHIDALILDGQRKEFLIELRFRQDAVHALELLALGAVIQRAVNCGKCWTQGGLKCNDAQGSCSCCWFAPQS